MSEREYILEMLCCTPKEVLLKRITGDIDDPSYWINQIPDELVAEAIAMYDLDPYKAKREEQQRYI